MKAEQWKAPWKQLEKRNKAEHGGTPTNGRERKRKAPEFGASLGYTVRLYLKPMIVRGMGGKGGETGRSEANKNKTKISRTQRFSCLLYSGPQDGKGKTLEALPSEHSGDRYSGPEP